MRLYFPYYVLRQKAQSSQSFYSYIMVSSNQAWQLNPHFPPHCHHPLCHALCRLAIASGWLRTHWTPCRIPGGARVQRLLACMTCKP